VKTKMMIAALISMVLLLAGCGGKQDDAQAWNQKAAETTPADDHAGHDHGPGEHAQPAAAAGLPGGTVLETFDSGGYTYVRLDTANGDLWAAGPVAEVAVGDDIVLEGAMVMQNFTSGTLDRTFAEIWFASGFGTGGSSAAADPHGSMKDAMGDGTPEAAAPDFSGLQAPADGRTIAQVHADRADLDGQRVKVRGKVVKSLSGIMGRNWLHLQDGTGDAATGDHDLTITTEQTAQVGATVLIDGVIAVDKDFGSGYFYTVIVEDALVTVEESM
jgi:hypothetical protein